MKRALRSLFSYVTSYNLRPKLFFSHLLVALAGVSTFVAASALFAYLEPGSPAVPTIGGAFLPFALASGLSAAVAAAASLFVSGRIVVPVRRMLAATRLVSAGRYAERVSISEDDELGELSRGFNSMAAALEEAEGRRREFISDVSHELGTPISTLQGYLEGTMDGVIEPSEDNLGVMYAEAERMRRLVNDLRQLSRAEVGQIALDVAPISPCSSVELAAESVAPLFSEKGVELSRRVPEDLPKVLADADRVAQILANLLTNALSHTPNGGIVTVCAGESPKRDFVVFEVRDTGSGITPEHLPRLFERFYRVEKSRSRGNGGSGLGLAISRAFVEAMGGEIRAESPGSGDGTTISFSLPVAGAAPG